jgi:hypothetical protein
MRSVLLLLAALPVLGCADTYLDEADASVVSSKAETLVDMAVRADEMSERYFQAAQATRTTQDLLAFVVFTSAASVITGAVGSASDAALAQQAVVGTGAQLTGNRVAPGSAVRAIFQGARRYNCVATAAGIGDALGLTPIHERAAVAATEGALNHIRILTREGIVREVPDFGDVLSEFRIDAGDAANPTAATDRNLRALAASATPEIKFEQYLRLLAKCTNTDEAVLDEVPKPG